MSTLTPEFMGGATGGCWVRDAGRAGACDGVGTDTRDDLTGKAFVALRGPIHDGHDHIGDAIAAGARAVVVERDPGAVGIGTGVLLVDDTRKALKRLAAAWRGRLERTTVIAVTGSVGKTTVKQLLDVVLSARRRGTAAPRSFNNDIGVPLTILAADLRDDYLIVEVGANAAGEIADLAAITRPDLAVITRTGRAHLEGFGGVEAVAREKASLLRFCTGQALVNADSPTLRPQLGGIDPVVLWGEAADADVRLTARGAEGRRNWFEINGKDRFRLGLPGRHNAVNALCAVAIARRLDIPDRAIDKALWACRPVEMRMSRRRIGPITVYNDAYNANPESMLASLETFAELSANAGGRRIIVLGDMMELGDTAAELHREVGRALRDLDRTARIDHAVLIGGLAAHIAEPLASWPTERVTRLDELTPHAASYAAQLIEPGDTVLLKGSRTIGLERLVDAIECCHTPRSVASGTR